MSKDIVARQDIKKVNSRIHTLLCKIGKLPTQEDINELQSLIDDLTIRVGDAEIKIITLEGTYVKVTNFEIISTASGGITVPTGGTIVFDQFNGTIDAIVSVVDGSNTPTWQTPRTASGDLITVTSFDSAGNYTLSGTPVGNISLIYVYRVQRKDFNYLESIGFETLDPTAEEIRDKYPRQIEVQGDRNQANVSNQYLRNGGNNTPMNLVGKTLPWNARLVKIIMRTQVNETWTAEVRKNGGAIPIDSLSAVATDFTTADIATDYNEDDEIQIYMNGVNISRPKVILVFEERV